MFRLFHRLYCPSSARNAEQCSSDGAVVQDLPLGCTTGAHSPVLVPWNDVARARKVRGGVGGAPHEGWRAAHARGVLRNLP